MSVMSGRKRRRARTKGSVRGGFLFVAFRVVPLVMLFAVAGEMWPAVHERLLSSPTFAIKQVLVSGNEYLTPEEVVDLGHVKPGMPLVALRPGAVEGRLKLHPRIAEAHVRFSFPRAVRLRVTERKPVAQIEGDEIRAVSRDGVLLPPVPGRELENLPLIQAGREVHRDGNPVRIPAVLEALAFLDELERTDSRLFDSVAVIDVTDARFGRVHLDSLDTALIYEIGGVWEPHVRVLPGVFEDLTREEVLGSVLDLRFREQIVRRGGVFAHAELASIDAEVR